MSPPLYLVWLRRLDAAVEDVWGLMWFGKVGAKLKIRTVPGGRLLFSRDSSQLAYLRTTSGGRWGFRLPMIVCVSEKRFSCYVMAQQALEKSKISCSR
jgi:hypothetical protein